MVTAGTGPAHDGPDDDADRDDNPGSARGARHPIETAMAHPSAPDRRPPAGVFSIHNFFATVAVPTVAMVHFRGGRSSGFLTTATAVCADGRRIRIDAVARPSGPRLTQVLAELDGALAST
jgi:hypothetical protein